MQLLYQGISTWFVYRVYKTGSSPEPYWAPGIIGCAMWSMQLGPLSERGLTLTAGMKLSVQLDFVFSLLLVAGLAPCILWRTVMHARSVACGPAVAIVAAPWSFICLAYFNSKKILGLPEWTGWALWLLSTGWFAASIFCGLHPRRREMIFRHPFNPSFGGFTFPLCTTASAALHFSKWLGDPLPVRIYAVGLSLATMAIVSFINVRYIVYVAMMARRTVQVARPRAFSQDQMAELLSDGADLSLIDYRSRGQLISVGNGENFYVEPLHDCVGFDIVRLRDTRGRPMLSELVEQEKTTNADVVAIYPRASDIERLMSP